MDWEFVHVPKTGGTSVRVALGNIYGFAHGQLGGQPHYAAYRIRDMVGLDRWSAAFTFAFVRNPWDRMASMYAYKTSREPSPEALLRWLRTDSPHCHTPQLYNIAEPLGDPPRGKADTVAYGEILVDFVGRFERLAHDFAKAAGRAGLGQPKLCRINNSVRRPDYRPYYCDEARELVAVRFADEIERFGYHFDG